MFEAAMGAGGGNPMVLLVQNGKYDKDFFLCPLICLLLLTNDQVIQIKQ
jgi:hypothetical protein